VIMWMLVVSIVLLLLFVLLHDLVVLVMLPLLILVSFGNSIIVLESCIGC